MNKGQITGIISGISVILGAILLLVFNWPPTQELLGGVITSITAGITTLVLSWKGLADDPAPQQQVKGVYGKSVIVNKAGKNSALSFWLVIAGMVTLCTLFYFFA